MDFLFGGMPDVARFVVAFLVVLGLIGAGAFLWRRFGGGPLTTTGPRGRQPRLAVIDHAPIDGRRRLVLVRRDNTEHLLMIGGPSDIVIESNIVRAGAAGREQRPPVADIPPRPLGPLDDQPWTQPSEPPARPDPLRQLARSEPPVRAVPPIPPERFRGDLDDDEVVAAPTLTPPALSPALPSELAVRPPTAAAPVPAVPPAPAYEPVFQVAPEPRRIPPALEPTFQATPEPPEPLSPPVHQPVFQSGIVGEAKRAQAAAQRPTQTDESNLAEMAQRLEAALRRPTKPVETSASAAPPPPPPPAPAVPRAVPRAEPGSRIESASRVAAYFEAPSPSAGSSAGRTLEPPPLPPDAPKRGPGQANGGPHPPFESLEDEMASLLGRSTGKT
jgi:flagellar protein FliO/FliZ